MIFGEEVKYLASKSAGGGGEMSALQKAYVVCRSVVFRVEDMTG